GHRAPPPVRPPPLPPLPRKAGGEGERGRVTNDRLPALTEGKHSAARRGQTFSRDQQRSAPENSSCLSKRRFASSSTKRRSTPAPSRASRSPCSSSSCSGAFT